MSADPKTLHTTGARPRPVEDRPIVVGLAGQPNVGKSTVFSILTGSAMNSWER